MSDLRSAAAEAFGRARADLERLVRIRSISADPGAQDDVRAGAEAVADLARDAGAAEARVVGVTGGAPAVIAHWPAPEGAPTVLLYAHSDVQPTGNPADWTSPPFEPAERDGRLYGRGAADDKAGVIAHITALRAFGGSPPVGVTLFVEGEEEIGSPTFGDFLRTFRDELAADVIVVADSTNWTIDTPALTTSLRGLVDCEVTVSVLDHSVHSGIFGGPVLDALTLLARLIATLHDDNGDVAVPGLAQHKASDVDLPGDRFRAEAGVLDGVSLAGTGTIADKLWTKPAISIVGLDATPTGEAANVLVHQATAKISMRIAPGQDTDAAMAALTGHLESNVPFGARVDVAEGARGAPCLLDSSGPAYDAARAAFGQAFGATPVEIGIGGSIPFIAEFAEVFPSAEVLVTGVEDPDSRAHGVDESLHLGQFEKVCLAETLLLANLGGFSGPRPIFGTGASGMSG